MTNIAIPMTYYQVPQRLDQAFIHRSGRTLIKGELYTMKECKKLGINAKALVKKVINKAETYFFFGVRFSV